MSEHHVEREQRVTPFELFFDLVFVFALTQVTTFLADDPTWHGLARAVLLLGTLWWAWAGYAWLTNTIDADEDAVLVALLAAMAALFAAALAVPTAFTRHPLVFGVAFLLVNLMHVTLYALAARDDPDFLAAVARMARTALPAATLILVAAFVGEDVRPWLWLAALAVGLIGPVLIDVSAWQLHPAHFVERHGLIIIIALGESLIAVGVGARDTSLGAGVIAAALLGLAIATSFWVAYFDFFAVRFEQVLTRQRGAARIALARDAYTYLHLPMVVGIVLTAFALRRAVEHVGHDLDTVSAFALCGGSALYLLSYVAMRWRVSRGFGRGRLVAGAVFAVLIPVAASVPAVAAVALVTATWVCLHAYEIIWWRDERAQSRALRRPSPR
ncbi:MAG TPA: low temperature requirement protein A [Gaiellaceae bacterium]|nr:low temperature requirement protein A [Gaiellaceae bacterium]